MSSSPPYRTSAEEFVDQLLDRLERRGLMRRVNGMVQLTSEAVAKVGYRPGDDLGAALGRLAAMVELETPDVQ